MVIRAFHGTKAMLDEGDYITPPNERGADAPTVHNISHRDKTYFVASGQVGERRSRLTRPEDAEMAAWTWTNYSSSIKGRPTVFETEPMGDIGVDSNMHGPPGDQDEFPTHYTASRQRITRRIDTPPINHALWTAPEEQKPHGYRNPLVASMLGGRADDHRVYAEDEGRWTNIDREEVARTVGVQGTLPKINWTQFGNTDNYRLENVLTPLARERSAAQQPAPERPKQIPGQRSLF